MSEQVKVQGEASSIEIVGLAEVLASKQGELRAVKAAAKLAEWETATKARNPQYVVGSVRQDTTISAGGHGHGEVCDIECLVCGGVRTVNKQDAFQVRYCLEHKNEGKRQANAERRAAKAQDPEAVKAKIAALEAKLAAIRQAA